MRLYLGLKHPPYVFVLATSIAPAQPGGGDLVEGGAERADVTALWHRARIGIAELSRTRPGGRYVAFQVGCISIVSPDTTWYHGSPTIDFSRAVLSASSGSRGIPAAVDLGVGARSSSPRFWTAASNAGRERMSQTIISVSSTTPSRSAAPGVISSSEPPICE